MFATSSAGRDQTCHHRRRIAWLCQTCDFRSNWALFSPLGFIVAVRRSSLFTIAPDELVRFSDACSLRRSRSAAQLSAVRRRASKGARNRYEGLGRPVASPEIVGHHLVGRSPNPRWRDMKPLPTELSIKLSQSFWDIGIAQVAFLTQIKQSHAERWHC